MENKITTPYKKIFKSLDDIYLDKEKTFKDIRDLLVPGTGVFSKDEHDDKNTIDYQRLLDSEPASYLSTTIAGLYGGMINPASRWFDLTFNKGNAKYQGMDTYAISVTLENITDFMYYILNKSNFYSAMYRAFVEWVAYGAGVLLVEERDWDFIFFNNLTVGEYRLGTNEWGDYTKLARCIGMSADKIISSFPKENIPDRIIQAYNKGDVKTKFKVYHLIMENTDGDILPLNFKFLDLYWLPEMEEGRFLRASGFYSNPIIVLPFDRKSSRTVYPMGIGEKILGDVKELQYTVKCLNINKSYLAKPPLALHTSLGNKPILPGATFYTEQDPTKVASEIFRVNPYIVELEDSRTRLLDKIRKTTMADYLMLFGQQQKPNMTAREVSAIVAEQMTLLAPVYMQCKQGLQNTFNRILDICVRRNVFANIYNIDFKDIEIEFMSSIAKAQRMAEVGSIQDLIMYLSGVAQLKPSALDYLNEDNIVKGIAERLGNVSMLRSDDEVSQIRQAQSEAQAQAMEMEAQAQRMKIAKDASKAKLDPATVLGQEMLNQGQALPPESYAQYEKMAREGNNNVK